MPRDQITDMAAALGLMNRSVRLIADGNGAIYAATARGDLLRLSDLGWEESHGLSTETCGIEAYLAKAGFDDAASMLSMALAISSLETPAAYAAFLDAVQSAGTKGSVLLRPASGIWPDVAGKLLRWPEGNVPVKSRCGPALQLLDLASIPDAELGEPDAQWFMENPDVLVRSADAYGLCYTGWSASRAAPAYVRAADTDFASPWRIVVQPDGSEDVASALPVHLSEPLFNYYETD